MTRPLHHSILRRALLVAVTVALVLAQALGLMHRVVHSPLSHETAAPWAAGSAAAVQRAASEAVAHDHSGHAHDHWLEALFADHDRSGCDGFDQHSHADLLRSHAASLCAQAVTQIVGSHPPALHIAAQAAGYLARGPPRRA